MDLALKKEPIKKFKVNHHLLTIKMSFLYLVSLKYCTIKNIYICFKGYNKQKLL